MKCTDYRVRLAPYLCAYGRFVGGGCAAPEVPDGAEDVVREFFSPPPDRRGEGPLTATNTSPPAGGRAVGRRHFWGWVFSGTP